MIKPIFYKPAHWNGEKNDRTPNVIPMKSGPKCAHGAYYKNRWRLNDSLDPRYKVCVYHCGLVVKVEEQK